MFKPWFNLTMLAAESQRVVWLRLMKLTTGGAAAQAEATLMVNEKIDAAADAATRLLAGATPDSVVASYRRKVKANARRLSK